MASKWEAALLWVNWALIRKGCAAKLVPFTSRGAG
jgi:hypothetical protein